MHRTLLAAVAIGLVCPELASAGCCGVTRPQTLRQRLAEAQVATLVTVTRCFDAATGDGSITELKVDKVLKAHAALGDQKVIHIPRKLEVDPKNPQQFLVLFDVGKNGKLDAWAGIPAKTPELMKYAGKAVALDPKDQPAQLQFFFNHLESADAEVAIDAWLELERTERADLLKAALRNSRA